MGANKLNISSIISDNDYVIASEDLESACYSSTTSYDAWLVSKGAVDVDINDTVDYSGKAVDAYKLASFKFEDQDVKSEISIDDIEIL